MLSVLFWNLMGRRIETLCANLVQRHGVDILVLAECANPTAVRRELNSPGPGSLRWYHSPTTSRVCVFSRFRPTEFVVVDSARRFAIHALSGPNRDELLVASVHASSGLRAREVKQSEELRELARRVVEVEDARGHTRTLLIGDLNADPFDLRVNTALGLHAEKTRRIAAEGSRTVAGVEYRFFYNPMWRFLGTQHPDPEGTYYYRQAEHDTRFWHVFDQALLRPALLPFFSDADVSVLLDDGTVNFRKADGTPNRKVASDHLPVLIKLKYPGV